MPTSKYNHMVFVGVSKPQIDDTQLMEKCCKHTTLEVNSKQNVTGVDNTYRDWNIHCG